jgi:dTDP-4-dehydrorhamnose 3,5-epimerase
MPFEPSEINGVYLFTPISHPDKRGTFREMFKLSSLKEELGLEFDVKQVNQSTSSKGVVRGIHFSQSPLGQDKYVSCPQGAIWDLSIDLRAESPSYGKWVGEVLSSENGKCVLIPRGVGHAFLALEDGTVVNYLCSAEFEPSVDEVLNPFSPNLAIDFQSVMSRYGITDLVLSPGDESAPNF